jgi:GMP synthase-like glutamine amidotransferase
MNRRTSICTTLAITHVAFEDLGSLGVELAQAGFNIQVIDACTTNLRAIDALDHDLVVVLGGPVSVYEHDTYPLSKLKSNCCGHGLPPNARRWVFVSVRS